MTSHIANKDPKLVAIKPQANGEIIAELQRLLASAITGEVTGLTVTAELQGHRIRTWAIVDDSVTLLGHLARQMAITNRGLDNSVDAS